MNITRVQVYGAEYNPPYEYRFDAGTRNTVWQIYASDFEDWASGDDPIAKAQFEIKGVRTIESGVVPLYPEQKPAYWRTEPSVFPYSEAGVLQLKSLWTASGKLRWMNPSS